MGEHIGPHVVHRPEGRLRDRETARKALPTSREPCRAGLACRRRRLGHQGEAGLFKGTVQHGQDVSLVRPGGKFGHHAAILGMNVLGSRELGHELRTTQHGNAGVVAELSMPSMMRCSTLSPSSSEFSIPHHSMRCGIISVAKFAGRR